MFHGLNTTVSEDIALLEKLVSGHELMPPHKETARILAQMRFDLAELKVRKARRYPHDPWSAIQMGEIPDYESREEYKAALEDCRKAFNGLVESGAVGCYNFGYHLVWDTPADVLTHAMLRQILEKLPSPVA